MTVLMETETEEALRDFLTARTSAEEFEAWIASAIDELSDAERLQLWELRLLLTESGEGLRPVGEARRRVSVLLQQLGTSQRSDSDSDTTEVRPPKVALTSPTP